MTRYASFAVELTGTLDAAKALSDVPAQILRAQQRALGTLRRRLATEAKRDIGAEYNLRAARIAEGLQVRNDADGVRLIGKSRGINAIEFDARWTRVQPSGVVATSSRARFTAIKFGGRLRGESGLGARWAVRRGEAPSVHAGSFIARGKNGALLVFERQGKKRLPIQSVYGPSVGQMLKHGRRPERLAEFAIRTLQSEQQRLLGSTP
ncbi:phage tail protein [Dyella ginsengisoli]|uniref:Phage tail protein n=1 Tax=Dyella ginsengisoli TaxID=363848 RepID=A0ABW8JTU7_9GAMM